MKYIIACETMEMGRNYAREHGLPGKDMTYVREDGSKESSIFVTDGGPLRGIVGDCQIHRVGDLPWKLENILRILESWVAN